MDKLNILYEDNHIIVVLKPQNVLSQGDETTDKSLLDMVKEYIKEKYNKPGNVFLGVVHRLDRPVSGLVVFAKTSKALSRLNNMFRDGEVHKTYWAIVKNKPRLEEAELVNTMRPAHGLWCGKERGNMKKRAMQGQGSRNFLKLKY